MGAQFKAVIILLIVNAGDVIQMLPVHDPKLQTLQRDNRCYGRC